MAKRGKISRRSFLVKVAGGSLTLGAGSVVSACATTGYTDSDPYDPVGGGRGGGYRSGITDADSGAYADPAGNGRGRSGITDSDPSDPVGNGRGRSGITDSDPSDPVGNGRGRRNCTDSDTGSYADPVGRGRRC